MITITINSAPTVLSSIEITCDLEEEKKMMMILFVIYFICFGFFF